MMNLINHFMLFVINHLLVVNSIGAFFVLLCIWYEVRDHRQNKTQFTRKDKK